MIGNLAIRRRQDFVRAARRAAQQLLTTGQVSERTQARLESGWRSDQGNLFRVAHNAVDAGHVDLLKALGNQPEEAEPAGPSVAAPTAISGMAQRRRVRTVSYRPGAPR